MKILVTGAAGFIGFHLTLALLERDDEVVGVDSLNDYYDPALKQLRLAEIAKHPKSSSFEFIKTDISDRDFPTSLKNVINSQKAVKIFPKYPEYGLSLIHI